MAAQRGRKLTGARPLLESMRARWSSGIRLAVLLLASSAPACEDDLPDRGDPIEQESEGEDLEDADVCVEECYPIKQDCGPGWACLPDNPGFSCHSLPALAEGPRRKLHDACEVGSQTCEPGLVCMQASVPGCDGNSGCCVAICDINEPECTEGTSCYPIFEPAYMCYPNVGVCVLL